MRKKYLRVDFDLVELIPQGLMANVPLILVE